MLQYFSVRNSATFAGSKHSPPPTATRKLLLTGCPADNTRNPGEKHNRTRMNWRPLLLLSSLLLSRNAFLKLQNASLVIVIIKYQVLSNFLGRSRETHFHCVRSSFEIREWRKEHKWLRNTYTWIFNWFTRKTISRNLQWEGGRESKPARPITGEQHWISWGQPVPISRRLLLHCLLPTRRQHEADEDGLQRRVVKLVL